MLIKSPMDAETASQLMDQKEHEISDLIARVAIRDRLAFNKLFQATSDYLLHRLTRILGSRQEAEDALQEVYVRVWLRATLFKPETGHGKRWLMSIARNYAIDLLRRSSKRGQAIDLTGQLMDGGIAIEKRLIAQSDARQICACIQMLNPCQAAVFQRVYLNGETYAELALRYNVPINTIRTWMRRSLQKVRLCMNRMSQPTVACTNRALPTRANQVKPILCRSVPRLNIAKQN